MIKITRHKALSACALLLGLVTITTSWTRSDGQARIPGWNRVAPPGGHQNDPQLVRATGGPVVPIFEGWFPNPDGTYQLCFGYFIETTQSGEYTQVWLSLDSLPRTRHDEPTFMAKAIDHRERNVEVLST